MVLGVQNQGQLQPLLQLSLWGGHWSLCLVPILTSGFKGQTLCLANGLLALWLWSEDTLCVQTGAGRRGTEGAWHCTESIYPKSCYPVMLVMLTRKPLVTLSPSTSHTAV